MLPKVPAFLNQSSFSARLCLRVFGTWCLRGKISGEKGNKSPGFSATREVGSVGVRANNVSRYKGQSRPSRTGAGSQGATPTSRLAS
ncbi:hypothetical protein FKM82_031196 [Ascaphus truei]